MSTTSRICQIPGNSDIAGIGVRASVYIQACLAGLNLIYMLHTRVYNDVPREDDIELAPATPGVADPGSTTTLDAPNIDVADATIISRPTSQPLSITPASVATKNLDPDMEDGKAFQAFVHANEEYINMIKGLERTLFMVGFAVILSAILEAKSDNGLTPYHALIILNISQINNWAGFLLLIVRGGFRPSDREGWASHFLVTRDSLVSSIPCMIHALTMSGLGLYFWSDLTPFLGYSIDLKNPEQNCRPLTYFWLFGAIDVSNNALRISSLVFYAISAIPVIGLYFLGAIIVFAFLGLIIVLCVLIPVLCVAVFIFIILYQVFIYPIIAFIIRPLIRAHFIQKIFAPLSGPLTFIAQSQRSFRHSLHSRTTALLVGPSYSQLFSFPLGVLFSAPLIYAICAGGGCAVCA
ncbi:hypothetical protein FPV67DRAFT_1507868 [Lyophyllum atratum]|nr:hypothetical protein FPV67DRAFT_1507868 [Lyophyllum atratum]